MGMVYNPCSNISQVRMILAFSLIYTHTHTHFFFFLNHTKEISPLLFYGFLAKMFVKFYYSVFSINGNDRSDFSPLT